MQIKSGKFKSVFNVSERSVLKKQVFERYSILLNLDLIQQVGLVPACGFVYVIKLIICIIQAIVYIIEARGGYKSVHLTFLDLAVSKSRIRSS